MTRDNQSVSFYFFDIDDNSLFLKTPILVRHRETGDERALSTGAFATVREQLGKEGEWAPFEIYDRSFHRFRDLEDDEAETGRTQHFVEDIERALACPPETWQAPSWPLLVHACEAQRPVALITARGHRRETVKAGMRLLVERGMLAKEPNYLAIYCVSNPEIEAELLGHLEDDLARDRILALLDRTSALKYLAVQRAVEQALERYGEAPPHRFGMSDDDPGNVDLIIRAMAACKVKYPDKRFFVINTCLGQQVKLEVFPMDHPVTAAEPRITLHD